MRLLRLGIGRGLWLVAATVMASAACGGETSPNAVEPAPEAAPQPPTPPEAAPPPAAAPEAAAPVAPAEGALDLAAVEGDAPVAPPAPDIEAPVAGPATGRVAVDARGIGAPVTLSLSAGAPVEDLVVTADGVTRFGAPLAPGAAWEVVIRRQAPNAACALSGARGTMGADDTTVALACGATAAAPSGGPAAAAAGEAPAPGEVLDLGELHVDAPPAAAGGGAGADRPASGEPAAPGPTQDAAASDAPVEPPVAVAKGDRKPDVPKADASDAPVGPPAPVAKAREPAVPAGPPAFQGPPLPPHVKAALAAAPSGSPEVVSPVPQGPPAPTAADRAGPSTAEAGVDPSDAPLELPAEDATTTTTRTVEPGPRRGARVEPDPDVTIPPAAVPFAPSGRGDRGTSASGPGRGEGDRPDRGRAEVARPRAPEPPRRAFTPTTGGQHLYGSLMREVGGGRPVAILPWHEGLVAVSADGTRKRVLVPGPVHWALVDERAQVVWFGKQEAPPAAAPEVLQGDSSVPIEPGADNSPPPEFGSSIDAPPPAPAEVPGGEAPKPSGGFSTSLFVLDLQGLDGTPTRVARGLADGARFEVRYRGSRVGTDTYLIGGNAESARIRLIIGDTEARIDVSGGGYGPLAKQDKGRFAAMMKASQPDKAAKDVVTSLFSRSVGRAFEPPRGDTKDRPWKIAVPRALCEQPDLCGVATRFEGTGYALVVVGYHCERFCTIATNLYDPRSGRYFDTARGTFSLPRPLGDDARVSRVFVARDGSAFVMDGRIHRFGRPPVAGVVPAGEKFAATGGGWLGGQWFVP